MLAMLERLSERTIVGGAHVAFETLDALALWPRRCGHSLRRWSRSLSATVREAEGAWCTTLPHKGHARLLCAAYVAAAWRLYAASAAPPAGTTTAGGSGRASVAGQRAAHFSWWKRIDFVPAWRPHM